MNSLYNHGIKQTQLITKDLSSFEKNLSTSPLSLQGSITTSLTAFKKTIKDYGDLVLQNSKDDGNTKHETRLSKFTHDLQDFTSKFESLKRQRENLIQETNKQELMGRRHGNQAQQQHNPENPYDPTQSQQQHQQQQQQLSYQEGLYKEKTSLARGTQQLDHILDMGQQAFEDIVEQNETLRKLQSKFEEGLVTLGVSQGTIRTIEKRAKQDKWLFWIAFIFMIICFWYILKMFR